MYNAQRRSLVQNLAENTLLDLTEEPYDNLMCLLCNQEARDWTALDGFLGMD